jgi:hypothetical protein
VKLTKVIVRTRVALAIDRIENMCERWKFTAAEVNLGTFCSYRQG